MEPLTYAEAAATRTALEARAARLGEEIVIVERHGGDTTALCAERATVTRLVRRVHAALPDLAFQEAQAAAAPRP